MKRFIFDLDGTLLTADYSKERDHFKSIFDEAGNKFISNIGMYLDTYEKKHKKYEKELLCDYLSKESGLNFTPKVIDEWNEIVSFIPDMMEDGVKETLEYLKSKDYSLAVLTNWFGIAQKKRLERAGLLEYFDDIYTGDMVLKPHKDSYLCARDRFSIDECVVIGDNLLKDFIAPRGVGMYSIIYDKNDIQHETITKVKRIDEIIKKY